MTIKRILEVTKSYAIRHFFKDKNFIKPFIKDLSNDTICRITCDTNDNDIESILFCDFHEKNNMAYNTVKFFKENKDTLITDKNIPVKNFKWWYGLYNGKLIVNTLNNLPDDMTVIQSSTFASCSSLRSVTIPSAVTNIQNDAFSGCTALTTIIFEGTVEQWNKIVFGQYWRTHVPATEVICSNGTVTLE
jgi:hypothetical protein